VARGLQRCGNLSDETDGHGLGPLLKDASRRKFDIVMAAWTIDRLGRPLGHKLGRPKIDSATERKVRRQLEKGVGMLKVARSLGLGTGTVQRIAKELG